MAVTLDSCLTSIIVRQTWFHPDGDVDVCHVPLNPHIAGLTNYSRKDVNDIPKRNHNLQILRYGEMRLIDVLEKTRINLIVYQSSDNVSKLLGFLDHCIWDYRKHQDDRDTDTDHCEVLGNVHYLPAVLGDAYQVVRRIRGLNRGSH